MPVVSAFLVPRDLPGITMKHEFNFVCTQNSVNSEEYFSRFNFFKDVRFANSN